MPANLPLQPTSIPFEAETETPERRGAGRHECPFVYQVAPYEARGIPGPDAFQDVECKDISAGGFAFWSSTRPDSDQLIAKVKIQRT